MCHFDPLKGEVWGEWGWGGGGGGGGGGEERKADKEVSVMYFISKDKSWEGNGETSCCPKAD